MTSAHYSRPVTRLSLLYPKQTSHTENGCVQRNSNTRVAAVRIGNRETRLHTLEQKDALGLDSPNKK